MLQYQIDLSIGAAKTSVIVAEHTNDALRTNAATAADRPPHQPDYLYSTSSNSSSNNSNHTTQFDDNQLDLLNSLDYDNGAINSEKKIVSETITATTAPTPTVLAENEGDALPTASMKRNENAEFVGDNYMEDYNDDSVSDISDLSDVFKLHADILPEMQRSIDWVCKRFCLIVVCFYILSLYRKMICSTKILIIKTMGI